MSLLPLVAAAICLAFPARAARQGSRLIRIGIAPGVERLEVVPEGDYALADAAGRAHALTSGRSYVFSERGGEVSVAGWRLAGEARLTARSGAADVRIGRRRYRGTLIVRANPDGTVTGIDELPIEQYLLGVLPLEMDPDWPLEALKAQAVVARTFAYTQLGKYAKRGFDLTADTRSQVYGGLLDDPASVRQAVEGTRGEVLGYKGEILNVYYHSCCGGHTADEGAVWKLGGPTPPPLRGVRDGYCKASPSYRWKVFVPYDRLLAALEGRHLIGGRLRSFSIGARAAGWVEDFVAKIGDETLRVGANDLRLAVGASQLPSARIMRVIRERGGVEFLGAGSGHGVGLCQWGAREQAARGRRYEKILKYYFPGSTLSVVEEGS